MPAQKPGQGSIVPNDELSRDQASDLVNKLDQGFVRILINHPQYDVYTKPKEPSKEVRRLQVLLILQGVILGARNDKQLHDLLMDHEATKIHGQRHAKLEKPVNVQINSIQNISVEDKESLRLTVIPILPEIAQAYFTAIQAYPHIEVVRGTVTGKPKGSPVNPAKAYYAYATEKEEGERWYTHVFTVHAETLKDCQNYEQDYKGLTGDRLKTKILENFIKEIRAFTNMDDVEVFKSTLENRPEYKVLDTSQGIATRIINHLGLFGHKNTSSIDALNKIIEEKERNITLSEPRNQ